MKKYYNPVKLLLSMPIDTLEAFVAEMVRRESESRVKKIMRKIDLLKKSRKERNKRYYKARGTTGSKKNFKKSLKKVLFKTLKREEEGRAKRLNLWRDKKPCLKGT